MVRSVFQAEAAQRHFVAVMIDFTSERQTVLLRSFGALQMNFMAVFLDFHVVTRDKHQIGTYSAPHISQQPEQC